MSTKECWILVRDGDDKLKLELNPAGAGYSIDLQASYARLYNRDYTIVVPREHVLAVKCPNKE